MAMVNKSERVEASSGNVFGAGGCGGVGDEAAAERSAERKFWRSAGMTQAEAAKALGVIQTRISALQHYKLEGFSVERLMHFVTALKHDVVIEIRPRSMAKEKARIVLVRAEKRAAPVGRRLAVGVGSQRGETRRAGGFGLRVVECLNHIDVVLFDSRPASSALCAEWEEALEACNT